MSQDEFGLDGTQAPPPPPLFADPVAGLVTGEQLYRPPPLKQVVVEAVEPAVVERVTPVSRPAAPRQPARRTTPAPRRQAAQPSAAARHVTPGRGQAPQAAPGLGAWGSTPTAWPSASPPQAAPAPTAWLPAAPTPRGPAMPAPMPHAPHAPLGPRPPKAEQPARPQRRSSAGGVIGCLVVLAAISGLLFNVVREIIEAVIDILK